MVMGRKRKHNKKLPERVYFRSNSYFFVDKAGRWHNLGREYLAAMIKYAEINQSPVVAFNNMAAIIDRYIAEVIPTKSPKTQHENARQIKLLRDVFGKMQPDDIEPPHVYQYLDRRPPVSGNREKALLSNVFSFAIRWGVAINNPCKLVKRNDETPRDRYVTDKEFKAVYDAMPIAIQIAMEFALLTGLRQGDILKLTIGNCTPEGLLVKIGKTGRRMLFEWTPELIDLVNRAKAAPSSIASLYLVKTTAGTRYTGDGFRSIWQRVMKGQPCRFTFHDIRAKASSDTPDKALLGHVSAGIQARVYQRTPVKVRPIRPKILDIQ